MSILINDLTVIFKNNVTAIDHGNLEIPNGILYIFQAICGEWHEDKVDQ